MYRKIVGYIVFIVLDFFLMSNCTENRKLRTEKYTFKNVQIVGGGFVDGYIFHPKEKDLIYARTDMGGAYRRDSKSNHWIPLMDWVSYDDVNLMGIESFAVDPNNPDKLYLACGTYTHEDVPDGEILRSSNRGKSFERVKVPFKMGGNENGRGNGERMTVDPNNGSIIYLGTRNNGLWKSTDGAKTWFRIESFPDITETMPDTIIDERYKRFWRWGLKGSGIVVVLCDPKSGTKKEESQTVYALVSLMNQNNFFRSNDAGKTWQPLIGAPQNYRPNHAVLAKNGNMYISYGDNPGPWRMRNGAIWKFNTSNGNWTDITPEVPNPDIDSLAMGYASVAVDPMHPDTIIASTFYRSRELGGEEIYRTTNGGKTWKGIFAHGATFDNSKAPYLDNTGIHWLFDLEIDPFNPDHALFTTGYGGHETFNLTDLDKEKPVIWESAATGIEETVPLQLLSPPKGAELITAIGDYGGFVHWNLDKPAPQGNFVNPHFGNTDGIACAWRKPEVIVRVGIATNRNAERINIGYTLDMGKTWQPTSTMPASESRHGYIAVSANGKTWIWIPRYQKPYRTNNYGDNWTELILPVNTRIVADKVNSNLFYGLNMNTGYYYFSNNGGKSFDSLNTNIKKSDKTDRYRRRGDSRGGQDRIYTTPGVENELWIAAFDGLYWKKHDDSVFIQIPNVSEINAFGFGKAAPGNNYNALYLVGVIYGERGIYRSDDIGKTWVQINDEQHQWGLILQITGDPKKYGRVYIGTHGRGTIYGDPL